MKQTLFKFWLMLVCLIVGVGTTWAESTVTTYTFNSKSWGATCNGSAANWTGSADGNQYSASNSPIGVQILAAGNGTTVTSPKSYTNVSKVVVNYSSSAKGVGSIKVSVGGTDIETKSISKSQSKVDLTYTPTTNLSGNVVITCNCTTNSYALVSVSITEETSGGSTPQPTALSVPTNLTSSNVTTTGATLSWDAVANASSYTVKIGAQEYTNVTTTSYNATGLTAGTQYTWSVKAVGDGENYSTSAYAANANFTTVTPTHKAYFYINGTLQNEGGTSFAEGAAINFPSDPDDINGKKFQGWTKTQNYSNASTAPSDMTKSATMGDADVTYYAVFATEDGEETTESFGWEEATTPSNWIIGGTITRTEANASNSANSGSYYGLTNSNSSVQFKNKVKVKSFSYNCVRRTTNTNTSIKIETSTNGTSWTEALSTTWNTFNSDGKTYKRIEKTWNEPVECYVRVNLVTAANRQLDDISITYGDVTISDYCTSVASLTGIAVTTAPSKVLYKVGETYDETGIVVTATYANGATQNVTTSCTNNVESPLTAGHKTITYTYNGETCTQEIDVVALDHIAVTTAPDKTEYTEDEDFDATGMVVTATWGTEIGKIIEEEITTYTLEGDKTLTPSSESVTIRYTHEGTTKTTTQSITVNAIPTYTLHITQPAGGVLTVKNGDNNLSDGDEIRVGTNLTCEVTSIPEGKRFSRFYFNYGDDQNKYKATNPATFDELPTEGFTEATITVTYQDLNQFTINWHINGSIAKTENLYEGAEVSAPSEIADISGKTFCGWVTTESVSPSDKPSYVYPTTATANADYYAVFATLTPGDYVNVTDNLTRATTGIENGASSYSSWSDKTATSDAVYAGSSAGGNDAIQLRTSSNSGIITTTSGGNAKSVTVTWNSNTANGRTLDVYGSNTAYTSIDDLFDNETAGTKIGSIVYGTSTELTINDDYKYIGLRSNSGAMYLTQISIDWESGTPDEYSDYCTTVSGKITPTLSFAKATYEATMGEGFVAPTLTNPENVTVSYTSSETSVATVDAESGAITLVGAGETTITATFEGNDDYNEASASYTLIVAVKHTAQFSVNGTIDENQNSTVAEGANITFPADPASQYGLTFMGWRSDEIEGALAEAPSMVNKTTEVMGNSDKTYYAVFAKVTTGVSSLEKLNNTSSFSIGDNIVVVATGSNWAKSMYQETVSSSYVSYHDFDGEASTIADDAKNYFTLSAGIPDGTWKLGDETHGHLYNESNTNNLLISNEYASSWTIAWDATESKFSIKNGNRWLSCRDDLNTTNKYKFRGGGTSTTSGTVYFDIYRFVDNSDAYTDYCTSFIAFDEANNTIEDVFDTYGRVEVTRAIKGGTDDNYGVWNTFCVPFDMNEAQIAENLGDAEVMELSGIEVSGSSINMDFDGATTIEAGKPYLVRVKDAVNSIVVRNATVNTTAMQNVTKEDGYTLTFCGNYTRQNANDIEDSYIISNNKFYFVDSDVDLKGFRAYITITGGSAVSALSFSTDDVTGISTNLNADQNLRIYNLQGLQQSKLQRGVNIVNGHKVIK